MRARRLAELPDERAQHLLRVLVNRYIREGHPVGSRTLSRESGLEVSPATIRNIMADLEDMGFISAPHTSAGRVPTIKGYRFFVDTLVKLRPPRETEVQLFEDALRDSDPQALVLSASNLLSAMTRLAGVVTIPRRAHTALRQIEFLPLSNKRILAILVLNDRDVQNKILHVNRDFGEDELRMAGNYLTEQFGGSELDDVRNRLIKQLRETRESMNSVMLDAIEMAQQAFEATEAEAEGEFIVAGETNLMGLEGMGGMSKLKRLFEAFSRQHDILHLLDKTLNAHGVQIFIGKESGYRLLDEYSVVAAPYATEDHAMGVLGVIGPTRMAYERVIPIVDVTAKLLGSALNSRN
ncbi:MAG: heat-inducible transcriptional repressor HrcA [Rhodospirillaceae bacterium]|nr:heat-inducible transcriptional repressor HrcA [Rhodospirillaceae bacterium]MDE0361188.1 heat-inducible transcriptional repressor HrcA [Rhodospirillaceae bacterium]